MNLSYLWPRIQGRYHREIAARFFRRPLDMRNTAPYISFSFDDFPRSAWHNGGRILRQYGLHATYYAAFGLMGRDAPSNGGFLPEDVAEVLQQGHELGCHTFAHCDSMITSPREFERSILKNREALAALVPGAVFRTLSYPINVPRLGTKRRASRFFHGCRGGGQTFNVGSADLNHLKAFFLEKRRDDPRFIKDVIDRNCSERGWLIFATHDISETPSPYGCTPSFFEEIVRYSVASGARIMTVAGALDAIRAESHAG